MGANKESRKQFSITRRNESAESVGDLMDAKSVETRIGSLRAENFGDEHEKERLTNIQYQYELKGLRDQYEHSFQEVGDANARVAFGKPLGKTLLFFKSLH